jgi:hypothetical protein
VRAEELRPFETDRPVTERRPFGGTGDDADVRGARHDHFLEGSTPAEHTKPLKPAEVALVERNENEVIHP